MTLSAGPVLSTRALARASVPSLACACGDTRVVLWDAIVVCPSCDGPEGVGLCALCDGLATDGTSCCGTGAHPCADCGDEHPCEC